ncbi:MAG: hypothetical protein WBB28_14070 [Crinalium sp.]
MLKFFAISLSIATLLITSAPADATIIRLRTVNKGRYGGKEVISVNTGSSKSPTRYFQIIYDYSGGRSYYDNREKRRKLTHIANCGSYKMSNAVKTESFDKNNRLISLNTSNYVYYSTPQIQSFEEKALQLTCKSR